MKKFLFLILLAIWSVPGNAVAAQSTTVDLRVLPLNCVFEVIDDGSNTLHYLTPAECGSAGTPKPGTINNPLQPAAEVFEPATTAPNSSAEPALQQPGSLRFDSSSSVARCPETGCQDGVDYHDKNKEVLSPVTRAKTLQRELIIYGVGAVLTAGFIVDATFFRLSMTRTSAIRVGNLCKHISSRKIKLK